MWDGTYDGKGRRFHEKEFDRRGRGGGVRGQSWRGAEFAGVEATGLVLSRDLGSPEVEAGRWTSPPQPR